MLSGGVGGARLARGLAAVLPAGRLTLVVNVGDDDEVYGVHVSPDLDTVMYTLAGIEGPHGWGIAGDTFTVMERLTSLGVDTSFRLGDRDLATCLHRTAGLAAGRPLSAITGELAAAYGIGATILPATDEPVRTRVQVEGGEVLPFQEYFVARGHRDDVEALEFAGSDAAKPAPGVVAAIEDADVVVIAPSNPPLSIWPILAVPAIHDAVAAKRRVVAVSPLFGGRALKGPAHRVLASLGFPPGNAGVVASYDGLVTDLVVDAGDADDAVIGPRVHVRDTRFARAEEAARFARELMVLSLTDAHEEARPEPEAKLRTLPAAEAEAL